MELKALKPLEKGEKIVMEIMMTLIAKVIWILINKLFLNCLIVRKFYYTTLYN